MKKFDKSRILKISFLFIAIMFVCTSIVVPIYTLLKKSFYIGNEFVGIKNFKKVMNTGDLVQALYNSITITLIVTTVVMIIGFLFAYSLERTNVKYKSFFRTVAMMPLFAPTMAYGIALIFIFGNKGILCNGFIGFKTPINIYGKLGIIVSEILYVFPSVCLIIMSGFRNIDYSLYEVADIMEISYLKRFITITLPNMKNSLINACFTAFILCFTDFGIPKVIGGKCETLALKFYQRVVGQNDLNTGAVVAVLLLIPCCVYFVIYKYVNKNMYDNKNIKLYLVKKNKLRDILFFIYDFIISLNIIVVFITLFLASVIKDWPYNLDITFKYYNTKSVGITMLEVYKNTIFVAFMSAIIGTIVVFIIAYVVERYKNYIKFRNILRFSSSLPLAIPGMVIGLSYILFFNDKNNMFNFLYGTLGILILSNIVHFFSVPFLTISQHLEKINKEYENVSESLGVPWYINFYKVILPISIIPIGKSVEYYFMNSMVTISAVSFLYNSKTKLASIEIMNKMDSGDISAAAAIVIIIIVINFILKVVFNLARNMNIKKEK